MALAATPDLELAQRYFANRHLPTKGLSTQAAALLEQGWAKFGSVPHGSGQRVAADWWVGVTLARPPRFGAPEGSRKFDLKVRYHLAVTTSGPVQQSVVVLTSPSWPEGLRWEQEWAGKISRVRPCQQQSGGTKCGPWRNWDAQSVIATAGEADLPVGIQAPLFLPAPFALLASANETSSWKSEDFFGREFGLTWQKGAAWPDRMWNAQGETRLLGQGEES